MLLLLIELPVYRNPTELSLEEEFLSREDLGAHTTCSLPDIKNEK